jgi:uncharacterized protein with gpF-like domain
VKKNINEGSPIGFGISFDLRDPIAEDFISKKTIQLRDAYRLRYEQKELATIQQKIKNQILRGFIEGQPVRTVADSIMNDLLDLVNITIEQAIAIASTELIGAANYARYVSINNSGFTKKQWFTAMDDKVRPLHEELHGKTINVGDLWVFSDGNTLRYPGDDLGPDHLVVGCRCIETIVPESWRGHADAC